MKHTLCLLNGNFLDHQKLHRIARNYYYNKQEIFKSKWKTKVPVKVTCNQMVIFKFNYLVASFLKILRTYKNADDWAGWHQGADDYAKDGSEGLFTKMHCLLLSNLYRFVKDFCFERNASW